MISSSLLISGWKRIINAITQISVNLLSSHPIAFILNTCARNEKPIINNNAMNIWNAIDVNKLYRKKSNFKKFHKGLICFYDE
jgi:hypothetical protein